MSEQRDVTARGFTKTLNSFRMWREGRHWQIEIGRASFWLGIASDRWMLGVIFNTQALNLGFGIGPVYFGIGAAYDR